MASSEGGQTGGGYDTGIGLEIDFTTSRTNCESNMSDLIYLGYDIVSGTIAMHNGNVLRIFDVTVSSRALDIITGLVDVSTTIPQEEVTNEDGVTVVVRSPWSRTIEYSDQAWSDLCEIAD